MEHAVFRSTSPRFHAEMSIQHGYGTVYMGPVMVCICSSQRVALFKSVDLLEEVCHCGDGLGDLLPRYLSMPSLFLTSFG